MMKKLVFIFFVCTSVSALGQLKQDTSAKLIRMYCGAKYSKVKPLFVIDGKISKDTLSLAKIGVQNIKSISVLKDSVATEIYGDDGNNGVIIITTKKHKTN
jgi:TonB-dependent SusC/RagA subfamily outer membrane receptor